MRTGRIRRTSRTKGLLKTPHGLLQRAHLAHHPPQELRSAPQSSGNRRWNLAWKRNGRNRLGYTEDARDHERGELRSLKHTDKRGILPQRLELHGTGVRRLSELRHPREASGRVQQLHGQVRKREKARASALRRWNQPKCHIACSILGGSPRDEPEGHDFALFSEATDHLDERVVRVVAH